MLHTLFHSLRSMRSQVFISSCLLVCVIYNAQAAITLRGATQNAIATVASGIAHVGSGLADDRNNCGNINPTIPAGITGDLLIALVIAKEQDATISMPGWNNYFSDTFAPPPANNNEIKAFIFWRLADGSDPNTITQGGNCNNVAAQISRFSGVDTSSPFETASPGVVSQDSGNIDTGTVTTISPTSMLLVAAFVSDNRNVAQGGGWSQSFDFTLNPGGGKGDLGLSLHYQLQTTVGAKSINNWDLSGGGTDENFGAILALSPDPSPATAGLTISVPPGTTTADFMTAVISVRPSTINITAPAGWTSRSRIDQVTGNSNAQEVFFRSATGSEPVNYTWVFSGVITGAAGGILSYSGVDTGAPFDVFAGNVTPFGTSHTVNSVTTTVPDVMLLSAHSYSSSQTWVAPAGMTEQVDIASITPPAGGGIALEINDVLQSVAGATGNKTATAAGSADTGAAHLLALRPAVNLVARYFMDEVAWTGTAAEVQDSSVNGLHGTSQNGANTAVVTPAIAGNPGTCRYGVFDGIDDFVNIADDPLLDIANELTVTVWVNANALPTGGNLKTIVSKDENFEFHLNSSGQINWWWGGGAQTLTSSGSIATAGWHHIAIVYSSANALQQIYIDGVADANTNNQSAALTLNADPLQIGADQGFAGRFFDGLIDEVRVYNGALSASDIMTIMNETHPCPVIVTLLSHYKMDETTWVGAGSVIDTSGNNNHASPLGGTVPASPATNPALAGDPGTCGYADIPNNTNNSIDAIDTNFTPANQGSITFWYNSKENWTGGGTFDRLLFDASNNLGGRNADKQFFMIRRNNGGGSLRFVLEDSNDTDLEATATGLGFSANTWVHVGVTWDLPNDFLEIYVNGVSVATDNTDTNGSIGNINDLYIGDNRDTGTGGNGWTNDSTNGFIDEFKIYDDVIPATQVIADMNTIHPCTLVDHYVIGHAGTGVTCQAQAITITAVDTAGNPVDPGNVAIDLSVIPIGPLPFSAKGDWTVVSAGSGLLANGIAADGVASYTFPGNGEFSVGLLFNYTALEIANITETINFNVDDVSNGVTDTRDSVVSTDPDLLFALTGFQFFNETDSNTSIPIQIAGKPSNVNPDAKIIALRAIRASDNDASVCVAAFPAGLSRNIELAAECNNPSTCNGRQLSITNNGITTAIDTVDDNAGISANFPGPTAPALLFEDDGSGISRALLVLSYADAGQLSLHARYDTPLADGAVSGNFMLGSSNTFVERPFGFDVQVVGNPAASGPGGGGFTQAGQDFTVTVQAVQWDANDDDGVPSGTANDGIPDGHNDTDPGNNADLSDNASTPNYGREGSTEATDEDIALSAVLDQPSAGTDPGLAGGTDITSVTAGSGSSTTLHYDEVGIIEIAAGVNDGDYLGSGLALSSKSGFVGRFFPDHFSFNTPTLNERVNAVCVPDSIFSYMDEMFNIQFTLEAKNALATPVVTLNYTGVFTNLPIDIAAMNYAAIGLAAPTPLSSRLTVVSISGSWLNGVAVVNSDMGLNRAANEDGPYEQFTIGIAPQDPVDTSVVMNAFDLDVDNNSIDEHTALGSTRIRFGRLFIGSAFGSELLPLQLPFRTEYFDGTNFIVNTDDACTGFDAATDLILSNAIEVGQMDGDIRITATAVCPEPGVGCSMTSISNNPVSSGDADLSFSAPDQGNTGHADVTVDLSSATGLDMEWLFYDWDGDGLFDNNPVGRVSFGIFNGPSEFIYLREPWN